MNGSMVLSIGFTTTTLNNLDRLKYAEITVSNGYDWFGFSRNVPASTVESENRRSTNE